MYNLPYVSPLNFVTFYDQKKSRTQLLEAVVKVERKNSLVPSGKSPPPKPTFDAKQQAAAVLTGRKTQNLVDGVLLAKITILETRQKIQKPAICKI